MPRIHEPWLAACLVEAMRLGLGIIAQGVECFQRHVAPRDGPLADSPFCCSSGGPTRWMIDTGKIATTLVHRLISPRAEPTLAVLLQQS